jgi:hypothetical protein
MADWEQKPRGVCPVCEESTGIVSLSCERAKMKARAGWASSGIEVAFSLGLALKEISQSLRNYDPAKITKSLIR